MSEKDSSGGFERLKALFLIAEPGFESFRTDESYIRDERKYKDELLNIYRREIAPLLTHRPDNDAALGEKALSLLRWPLEDMAGKPQNLVGWRYVADLYGSIESRRDGFAKFGSALRRLLDPSVSVGARIDEFVTALNNIIPPKHSDLRRRGPQTAITSFYLGLSDPANLLFIKSTQLDDLLDIYAPEYERSTERFTGDDYSLLLSVAKSLFDSLTQEGWEPADLIDVQGFVWVSLTQAEGTQDDDSLVLRLTAGAIKNGYLTLSSDDIEYFGDRYCGGPSADDLGQQFRLELPDAKSVTTDIRRAKPGSAGRIRARFNALFQANHLRPGDVATIERLGTGKYRLVFGLTQTPQQQDISSEPEAPQDLRHVNKNIILYGPPGTGKTYHTASLAVEICTGSRPSDRDAVRAAYDQLRKANRIAFVTFHQSFAYEEFIEGLRPVTDSDSDTSVRYEIRDGIFKRLCSLAGRAMPAHAAGNIEGLRQKRLFKMSLGNIQVPDDSTIFEEALQLRRIALNWGGRVDYSTCGTADEIRTAYAAKSTASDTSDYAVIAVDYFKNLMKVGDLVLISDGNTRFRAIGEVTGEYQYIDRDRFPHVRSVRWLATFDPSLPVESILEKRLSQMTIYRPDPSAIKWDALEELLRPTPASTPINYVLIIDEINRANISKVFGELITLLEPDKRIGAPEELRTELPYSREIFGVPDNIYVVGTMNTADRSLALLDTALRRRFEFREMRPETHLLSDITVAGISIQSMLETINDRIELLYDREHAIGHAFFLPLREDPTLARLGQIFETRILPLLQEYFFEDWARIRHVLGDPQKSDPHDQFITIKVNAARAEQLLSDDDDNGLTVDGKRLYERNPGALNRRTSYLGIYREISRTTDSADLETDEDETADEA